MYSTTNADWNVPTFAASFPNGLKSGTSLGLVDFGYQTNAYSANSHYAFEVGIPILNFGAYWTEINPEFTVHWTMNCGNDALDLHVPAVHAPEPATGILMLAGLGGFLVRRKFLHRR